MEGLKRGQFDPILVKRKANLIVVSSGNFNYRYGIHTDVIYTVEVISGAGKTDVKIKQENNKIGNEWRYPKDWDGKWADNIFAIEYPNKDLWSDHPVLNELKLTSLVSSTAGESGEPTDSNEKISKEQQNEKQAGNYQNGYLVFPDKE